MTNQGGKDWTILDGDVEIPEGAYVDPGDNNDFCTECSRDFAYTQLGHAYCHCGVWFPSSAVAHLVDDSDPVDDNYPGRFDGIPGLVWYAKTRKVLGADLRPGDWLDSLDHRGARMIYGIWFGQVDAADLPEAMVEIDDSHPDPDSPVRTVMLSFGDTEAARADVLYDVVDPDSQVSPDGSPL
jgi:hypothetical protein